MEFIQKKPKTTLTKQPKVLTHRHNLIKESKNIVIGSKCGIADCYKHLGREFDNPFMYAYIPYDDFYVLASQFDTINFENVKTEIYSDEYNKNYVLLTIDDKLKIHFIHHIFQESSRERKEGPNFYSNDIINHVVDKYFMRIKRMQSSLNSANTKIVFVYLYCFNDIPSLDTDITDEKIKKMEKIGVNCERWDYRNYNTTLNLKKYFNQDL